MSYLWSTVRSYERVARSQDAVGTTDTEGQECPFSNVVSLHLTCLSQIAATLSLALMVTSYKGSAIVVTSGATYPTNVQTVQTYKLCSWVSV